jgi:hypothetical protein
LATGITAERLEKLLDDGAGNAIAVGAG